MQNKVEADASCQIVIMGPDNSGKSCLILRYTGRNFPTIHFGVWEPIFKSVSLENKMVLNKIEEEHTDNKQYIKEIFRQHRGTDAIILTVDITDPEGLKKLNQNINLITNKFTDIVVISIAVTKCDKIESVQKNQITSYVERLGIPNILLHFVSSINGDGIDELFESTTRKVLCNRSRYNSESRNSIVKESSEISNIETEMAQLIDLITRISSDLNYWQGKVQKGYGIPIDNAKIPENVSRILLNIRAPNVTPEGILKNIGNIASSAYSAYFQWVHSFFRGRDDKTNNFYGILSKLNQDDGLSKKVIQEIIKELTKEFSDQVQSVKEGVDLNLSL